MRLLNKIFGGSREPKEEKLLPWIMLNSLEQLSTIEQRSNTKTQVIFKYSTRCGVSSMVMNQFVSNYNFIQDDIEGFDSHPGPYWHYAISRRLLEILSDQD